MKKYKILASTMRIHRGKPHYRIKALVDILEYGIRKGDLGGWVNGEHNLSHEGNCWVANEATVTDSACVKDNAFICNKVEVMDNAIVSGDAYISDNVVVADNAFVSDHTYVFGQVYVLDDAKIIDHAQVSEEAVISGDSIIQDYARVKDSARITWDSTVRDHANVFGHAYILSSTVGGWADIGGNVHLAYGVTVEGDTELVETLILSADKHPIHIDGQEDIYVFKNNWSSGRTFCYIANTKLWIVGCFKGTGEELTEKAYKDSELSGDMYSSYVELVERLESKR